MEVMFLDRRNSIFRGSKVRESNLARAVARSHEKTKANQTKIHHAAQLPYSMCSKHIVFLKQR